MNKLKSRNQNLARAYLRLCCELEDEREVARKRSIYFNTQGRRPHANHITAGICCKEQQGVPLEFFF